MDYAHLFGLGFCVEMGRTLCRAEQICRGVPATFIQQMGFKISINSEHTYRMDCRHCSRFYSKIQHWWSIPDVSRWKLYVHYRWHNRCLDLFSWNVCTNWLNWALLHGPFHQFHAHISSDDTG